MFNFTSNCTSFAASGSEIWHPKGMGEEGLTCGDLILPLNALKQGSRSNSVSWQVNSNIKTGEK